MLKCYGLNFMGACLIIIIVPYGTVFVRSIFTRSGDPSDSGVLPRSLDVVFNSIDGRIYDRMDLKPDMYCGVVRLGREQEANEIALKESIMKLTFDVSGFDVAVTRLFLMYC